MGGRFTVADVNVGAIVEMADKLSVPLGDNIQAWMKRFQARPAYQRVRGA